MSVNDYDQDLYNLLSDLEDDGDLEKGTPAHGIAMKVVHDGYGSLSPKQRTLFDAVVVPLLERRGEEIMTIQALNSAAP
jgi:hypothetical protein